MNTSHRSRTIGGYVAFRALETGWKSSCSNKIYELLHVRFHCTDQESTSVSDDGAEASNSSSSKYAPGVTVPSGPILFRGRLITAGTVRPARSRTVRHESKRASRRYKGVE